MLVALKIPSLLLLFLNTFASLFFSFILLLHFPMVKHRFDSQRVSPHRVNISTRLYRYTVLQRTDIAFYERAHIHTYNTYIGIATNCALPRRVTSRRTMPGRIHPTFALNDRLNLPYDLHISPVALPDTIAYFHTQLNRHTIIDTIHLHRYTQNGGRARICRTCEKFVRTRYDFICIYLHTNIHIYMHIFLVVLFTKNFKLTHSMNA